VSGSPSARATVTASAVAAETSARRHMGQRRRAWATETARETARATAGGASSRTSETTRHCAHPREIASNRRDAFTDSSTSTATGSAGSDGNSTRSGRRSRGRPSGRRASSALSTASLPWSSSVRNRGSPNTPTTPFSRSRTVASRAHSAQCPAFARPTRAGSRCADPAHAMPSRVATYRVDWPFTRRQRASIPASTNARACVSPPSRHAQRGPSRPQRTPRR